MRCPSPKGLCDHGSLCGFRLWRWCTVDRPSLLRRLPKAASSERCWLNRAPIQVIVGATQSSSAAVSRGRPRRLLPTPARFAQPRHCLQAKERVGASVGASEKWDDSVAQRRSLLFILWKRLNSRYSGCSWPASPGAWQVHRRLPTRIRLRNRAVDHDDADITYFHCMQVVARVMDTLQLQSDALHKGSSILLKCLLASLIRGWLASG